MSWIRRIAVDVRPLRESRDFRLLTAGSLITGLGTQATLVALPYQVFVITGSAFQTGLIGAAELIPLAAGSLYGGALADRFDRRIMLLTCQLALVTTAAALSLAAISGEPPIWLLYLLAAAMAGAAALEQVVRAAIVPNTVSPDRLRGALSLTYGLAQLTQVVGPAVGGLLIAAFGLAVPYAIDAVSCLGMAVAASFLSPQPVEGGAVHEPVLRSIRSGLAFVRRQQPVMAGFVIDLAAMTFGMPRALFPVLSLTVYHAGASGTGLLYAAVAAGSTVAALTTGWLLHARWLGRIVLGSVAVWGVFIALAGLVDSIWIAALLFALAGAADSVSAVCRTTMSQTLTPDRMRGRMTSVFGLVVTGGPRLGDIESGSVAAVSTPAFSVVSGGLACLAAVGLVAVCFPQLAAYDGDAIGAGALDPDAIELAVERAEVEDLA
ncbi:MAG: MFS transporter [Actinobacteria bacterium]|nr:MFS transporter [Actinomycetota bacterium]